MNPPIEVFRSGAVDEEEILVPVDPIHGDNVSIRLHEISDDKEEIGGMLGKNRVVGRFVDNEGRESGEDIHMIIKNVYLNDELIGGEKISMTPAQRYFERWRYLRNAGILVVPNVVVLDENRVAMTEMAVNGSEFFGKSKSKQLERERLNSSRRDLTPAEQAFLELDLDKVRGEIESLRENMYKRGVLMSHDDPGEILVSPDGKFEPVIVDIKYLYKATNSVYNRNDDIYRVQQVMDFLAEIRTSLMVISGAVKEGS